MWPTCTPISSPGDRASRALPAETDLQAPQERQGGHTTVSGALKRWTDDYGPGPRRCWGRSPPTDSRVAQEVITHSGRSGCVRYVTWVGSEELLDGDSLAASRTSAEPQPLPSRSGKAHVLGPTEPHRTS